MRQHTSSSSSRCHVWLAFWHAWTLQEFPHRLNADHALVCIMQVQVQASTAAANPPISLAQRALLQTAARRKTVQQQVRSSRHSAIGIMC